MKKLLSFAIILLLLLLGCASQAQMKFKSNNERLCTNFHTTRAQLAGEMILNKSRSGYNLVKFVRTLPSKNYFRRFIILGVQVRLLHRSFIIPYTKRFQSPPGKVVKELKDRMIELSKIALMQCRGQINMPIGKWKSKKKGSISL